MHIPDGFLSNEVCIATSVVSLGAVAYSLHRMKDSLADRTVPLTGMMGSLIFAGQMVNFPIGLPVSGHLMGGVLAAAVLGPWAGCVAMTMVLVAQWALFSDGGLTALGANVLHMGVVGSMGGYAVLSGIRRLLGNGRRGSVTGAVVAAWLSVMAAAHRAGLGSTATIMYGHVEQPKHWARHLLRIRHLQAETGGFTEFVPLPFVHMEAPMYLKGRARRGPTFREAMLMHAVARLVLHPLVPSIQASWVKLGPDGVAAALAAGVNDLGGTLMNETISRAAGTQHGQEMPPERMDALIRAAGRTPRQRTTLYGTVPEERMRRSFQAAPLEDVVNTPAARYVRGAGPRRLVRAVAE